MVISSQCSPRGEMLLTFLTYTCNLPTYAALQTNINITVLVPMPYSTLQSTLQILRFDYIKEHFLVPF